MTVPQDNCALFRDQAFILRRCIPALSVFGRKGTHHALTHEMRKRPAKLYLSLGDREARTRNSVLMTVQRYTEELVEHYRSLGLAVTWELNPGNHFKDAALRSAKGIKAILE